MPLVRGAPACRKAPFLASPKVRCAVPFWEIPLRTESAGCARRLLGLGVEVGEGAGAWGSVRAVGLGFGAGWRGEVNCWVVRGLGFGRGSPDAVWAMLRKARPSDILLRVENQHNRVAI